MTQKGQKCSQTPKILAVGLPGGGFRCGAGFGGGGGRGYHGTPLTMASLENTKTQRLVNVHEQQSVFRIHPYGLLGPKRLAPPTGHENLPASTGLGVFASFSWCPLPDPSRGPLPVRMLGARCGANSAPSELPSGTCILESFSVFLC